MDDTATICGPPSLSSPTATTPILLIRLPPGWALNVARAFARSVEAVERDLVAVVHSNAPREPFPDVAELLQRLERTRRERALHDPHKSNADGAASSGLPSYTERRFAPPSWPREPRTRAHVDPGLAVRQRRGREALRRRKRSRDHARTGRR